MEGFFGRPQNELFHGRDWGDATHEKVDSSLDGYLRCHDEAHPMEAQGWTGPLQHGKILGLVA